MGKELFKNIPSKVGDLVKDVRNGRIGLPDLQRPFVWRDNKVRELFDSMLKGYPIGYIMLWESPVDYESKKSTIGDNSKTYEEPKELVIDGQQRLTALVAAMFSVKVKDKNFADREIKISYNPLTREFAVWSQAYEKDTEWISRISDVFLAKEDNSISSLRRRFIKEANEGRSKKELPLLTDEEEDRIEDNINALLNLSDYAMSAFGRFKCMSSATRTSTRPARKLFSASRKSSAARWRIFWKSEAVMERVTFP